MVTIVYFDGLCEPVNPGGIAAYGFVIYRDGKLLSARGGVLGAGFFGDDVTNNVAEYTALIKALEWLVENGLSGDELVVRGDSQLVLKQLKGEYTVKSKRITPLYQKVTELLKLFPKVTLEWVPRQLNAKADSLSREAVGEFLRRHPEALNFYKERYRRAKN
ncbi:MAG: ribonuclease HI family protein [Thermofilaceae archaeon]|nr:ribonuclease HI family protein [Thermofilaceae archaeon]MCX8180119.1 ribonuclease HI family protein [Thermofilaceae archaeon]MDW8004225.1 ribonuclease HI [Thermofilaceae archaeon]